MYRVHSTWFKQVLSLFLAFCLLLMSLGIPSSVYAARSKLSTPTNLQVNGTTVSWSAVTNATGYDVRVFEEKRRVKTIGNGTKVSIDLSGQGLPDGKYTVRVMAKGEGKGYSNSDYSANSGQVTIVSTPPSTKLSTPTILQVNGTAVSWSAVANAAGYEVRVYNGNSLVKTIDNGTKVSIDLSGQSLSEGSYNVKILAKGNGSTTVDSDETEGIRLSLTNPWFKDAANLSHAYDKHDSTYAYISTNEGYIIYKLETMGVTAGEIQYRLGTSTGNPHTINIDYLDKDLNMIGSSNLEVNGLNDCYNAVAPAQTMFVRLNGVSQANLYIYEISNIITPIKMPGLSKNANNLDHAYDGRDHTSANIFTADGYIIYKLADLGLSSNVKAQYLLGTSTGHAYPVKVEYLDSSFNVIGNGILEMNGHKDTYTASVPSNALYLKMNGISQAALYIYEISATTGAPSTPTPVPTPIPGTTPPALSKDATNLSEAYDKREHTSANILTGEGYIIYKLSELGVCGCNGLGQMKFLMGVSDGYNHSVGLEYLDRDFKTMGSVELNVNGLNNEYTTDVNANATYIKIHGVSGAMIYIYEASIN